MLGPDLGHRFKPASILARIGPFTIIEYVPMIEYGSWRYANEDGQDGSAHRLHDEGWTPVEIPTRTSLMSPPTATRHSPYGASYPYFFGGSWR